MEMTRNVGIAAAIPALSQELEQIELIPLADRRVLTILVTRDRMVRNRVVTLDEPIPAEELISIRNYINRNFSGWQLGEARRELVRRMLQDRELFQAAMRKAPGAVPEGSAGHGFRPGSPHGRRFQPARTGPAPDAREDARAAARAGRKEAADRAAGPLPGAAVRASWRCASGLEEAHPAMKDLALIGMTVRMAQRTCPRKWPCSAPCGCITSV